jgi:hypothetical protein
VVDPAGKLLGYRGADTDVTERKAGAGARGYRHGRVEAEDRGGRQECRKTHEGKGGRRSAL